MSTIRDALSQAVQHQQAGQLDLAEGIYRQVLTLNPKHADALHLLGSIHLTRQQLPSAEELVRRAIAIYPNHANFHNTLGLILAGQEHLHEASAAYREALRLKPEMSPALFNLAHALINQGEVDEAIDHYRRSLELQPNDPDCHSNLLYAMHFDARSAPQEIHAEARRWNARHAAPLRSLIRGHDNDRDPNRPLRVGYVSADLWAHAVGRFLLPLLENHHRDHIEAYCYNGVSPTDTTTGKLRRAAHTWRNIGAMSDGDASSLIREDRIDILVDLSAHSGMNRLLLFALKPAPIQVSYLGYPGTTGLETMDYRITDPYLEPPGGLPSSEVALHLPETYWCYSVPDAAPEINDLPASGSGFVTFGCMNKNYKVSNQTLEVWAKLLAAVKGSRLVLHAHEGIYRQRVSRVLGAAGIDLERVTFIGVQPLEKYFSTYQQFDIALDPFPYNGGTVTCDALWMGVPVVSLAGEMPVHRAGLSLLSNVGLPDLVATNPEEYITIASNLAGNFPRLSHLRATLRDQMRSSPLMNASRFATNMESAYRDIWRRWCANSE